MAKVGLSIPRKWCRVNWNDLGALSNSLPLLDKAYGVKERERERERDIGFQYRLLALLKNYLKILSWAKEPEARVCSKNWFWGDCNIHQLQLHIANILEMLKLCCSADAVLIKGSMTGMNSLQSWKVY